MVCMLKNEKKALCIQAESVL